MSVDKNEAPEGYEAVQSLGFSCCGCAFEYATCCGMCISEKRKDECTVIFKKKETDK